MEVIRLVTVHPVLVHLTIGLLPAMVLAYYVAAALRSEKWTFVGDVLVVLGALVTVATFAFGLVSNAVLHWPGGIGIWRWLHLGFGAAVALLLVVFAIARISRRGRIPVAKPGTLAMVTLVALMGGFTGWIGGEVLVYHSGMAVSAAGDGALAPPLTSAASTPNDVHGAMGEVRGAWAGAQTRVAEMIVGRPWKGGFEDVARHAKEMESIGRWLAVEAPKHMKEGGGDADDDEESALTTERRGALAFLLGPAPAWAAEDAGAGGPSPDAGTPAPGAAEATPQAFPPPHPGALTKKEKYENAGGALERSAHELLSAAQREDLETVSTSLGDVTQVCAGCHIEVRWKGWSPKGPTGAARGD